MKNLTEYNLIFRDELIKKVEISESKSNKDFFSFNWSSSAAHTNDETLLVIQSAQLAQHFTREMGHLWGIAELGITTRSAANWIIRGFDVGRGWRGTEKV